MLLRRAALLLLAAWLAPAASGADEGDPVPVTFTGSAEAGTGTAAFRLGFYHNDDDGDGNPFLDEELTVIEPIVIVDYNVTDRLGLGFKFSYDNVTSASIERLTKFPNTSEATGDEFLGGELAVRYEIEEDLRVRGFVNVGNEYDYRSIGFGGDVARDLAEKNATLKLGLNGYVDRIRVIRFNGDREGYDDRYSAAATLSWYQVIDPKTHGDFGLLFGYQRGFLETPYNAVVFENPELPPNPNLDNLARGLEFTEELPSTRIRGALFGKVRRWLRPGTSAQLGGRFYGDSWGLFSGAVHIAGFQSLLPERLLLRLGYRFYAQSAVDYFKRHFTTLPLPRHRTQDSDLADFNSHGLDLKLIWQITDRISMDIGGGYTFRSDGLDYITPTIGFRWDFDAGGLHR